MNISCPECRAVYRIDLARVPGGGVRTRCEACSGTFLIDHAPEADRPGLVTAGRRPEPATELPAPGAVQSEGTERAAPAPAPAPASAASAGASAPAFGPQDPRTRARRLARALVSDIKVYHRDRWEHSALAGTLRTEFRQEILKSWDEYVEQVGEEMAKRTPYFRDALNDILADGGRVF
jgi:predicted Zn finger-like uncharacterized protein